ncbi:hypothetical protein DRQ16_02220 [bacterium]|nr:MAG: hypothetical protein DRQ16_02220 [bacterium]RKZ26488.1 MAG: hypothetical protein DRQ20_02820 [bacterium]
MMQRKLPLLITFVTGVIMVVAFFVPHPPLGGLEQVSLRWYSIIAGFTLLLGADSLIRTHIRKIRRRENVFYSTVLLCALGLAIGAGAHAFITRGSAFESGTFFMYLYDNLLIPLQATMFSLLAFFIASAAYRAFRARNLEATLLLIAAVLVMLGRVPLGEMMWSKLPVIAEWIFNIPQMAAKRGILIGSALGAIAMSLRIILGIERTYLS